MPADPNRVATLFAAAVAMQVAERAAYLDQACDDVELRRRVEALLQAYDDAGSPVSEAGQEGSGETAEKEEKKKRPASLQRKVT